jgi:hypothetical protein
LLQISSSAVSDRFDDELSKNWYVLGFMQVFGTALGILVPLDIFLLAKDYKRQAN